MLETLQSSLCQEPNPLIGELAERIGQYQKNRSPLDDDMELLVSWFPGKYSNNEQVWLQKAQGVDKKNRHEHIHHIFMVVDAPKVGQHVFFVKQYSGSPPIICNVPDATSP